MCTQLILATIDPKLINPDTGKWNWTGSLYYAVACTGGRPAGKAKYTALDTVPAVWDSCRNVSTCQGDSMSIFDLYLTFSPDSTDPGDYLKFTFEDDRLQRPDALPNNFIKDSSGKSWRVDITEIHNVAAPENGSAVSVTEIWLSLGGPGDPVAPVVVSETAGGTGGNKKGDAATISTVLLAMLGILAVLAIVWFISRRVSASAQAP